jgi:DNA-binding NarL/FixJ family response regulator
MAMIHVVLVDDHTAIREELRTMLQSYQDIEVVGEAANGVQAIEVTGRVRPDIVVMDVHMPGMNGVMATDQIKRLWPETVVVAISTDVTPYIEEAMGSSGAAVLIAKEEVIDSLYPALKAFCPHS